MPLPETPLGTHKKLGVFIFQYCNITCIYLNLVLFRCFETFHCMLIVNIYSDVRFRIFSVISLKTICVCMLPIIQFLEVLQSSNCIRGYCSADEIRVDMIYSSILCTVNLYLYSMNPDYRSDRFFATHQSCSKWDENNCFKFVQHFK